MTAVDQQSLNAREPVNNGYHGSMRRPVESGYSVYEEVAMNFWRTAKILLTIGILLLFCAVEARAITYSITDLGTLTGGEYSFGYGVNNAGQVAGYADTTSVTVRRAFLYSGGTMTALATLGGVSSFGNGINDSGQITGESYLVNEAGPHAFIYNGTTMIDLGTLGGADSYGYGINNSGQVTGCSSVANGNSHAFIYNGGALIDLGLLDPQYVTIGNSFGFGINNSGQVTGKSDRFGVTPHAFIYSGGIMTDIGTLGGRYNDQSAGHGINDAGQVTGDSTISNGNIHAFIYSVGTMIDLRTLGGTYSSGDSINNAGQVVGASSLANGDTHAFVYTSGKMYDLNNLIPAGSDWNLVAALGINNSGQITGYGYTNHGQDEHAFLLTPDTVIPVLSVELMRSGNHVDSYAKIQDAYDDAADGDVIMAQNVLLTENLSFAADTSVSVNGGYDSVFASEPGVTTLKGSLTIKYGDVTLKNLIIE